MIWLVKHTVFLSCHIFRWIEPPPQTSVKRGRGEKTESERRCSLWPEWMSHSCVRQRSWPLSSCAGVSYGHYSQTTHLRERNTHNASLWQSNVDILKKMLATKLLRCCSGGLLAQKSPLSSSSQYPILNILIARYGSIHKSVRFVVCLFEQHTSPQSAA